MLIAYIVTCVHPITKYIINPSAIIPTKFLNSFFDQLLMYKSKFGFTILKEQVKGFHLHVLKLQIAHGKGVQRATEHKKVSRDKRRTAVR